MRRFIRKGISMVIALAVFAVLWPGAVLSAQANVEPPMGGDFTLTADRNVVATGDTVNITAGFYVSPSIVGGYSATQVVVLLPAGLDYVSGTIYVGGVPSALTTIPSVTPTGTTVIVNLDNATAAPGEAQLNIAARASGAWNGASRTIRASFYQQPIGGAMPGSPDRQAEFTLQSLDVVTPAVITVEFRLNGGIRVGGGALSQAVPSGGSAVEPYVFRDGYIFLGWDVPFYNITQNTVVTARWTSNTDTGMITVPPPSQDLLDGYFVDGRNTFTHFSHMPKIFYAYHHIVYFQSVEIDGRTLESGTHYIATTGLTEGTTAIHLRASYLNNLAVGAHVLRVNFRDGAYATAQLTVLGYTNPFYDVTENDWFYQGVEVMHASELLQGVSSTQFGPYSSMSRAMVVTLLYRFTGEPAVAGFRNPFPDVTPGQYYTNAVIWAAANGIVTGHENGLFAPNDQMTREQLAAVLYRYQNSLGTVPTDILADRNYSDFNQIGTYARAAVNKLTMQGVFRDFPYDAENRFKPQDAIIRAEVATVMWRWIESIGW